MTSTSEILNVPVEHLLEAAANRAALVGSGYMNSHSMRGLAAMQAGALGELVFMEYLQMLELEYTDDALNEKTHDLVVNNKKIDVKSKERGLKQPTEDWDCTISDYLSNYQDVDFYAFISLRSSDNASNSTDIKRFVSADILGTISKEMFSKKAFFIKKGDIDWSNGFVSHKDQWNIKISDLRPPKQIRTYS